MKQKRKNQKYQLIDLGPHIIISEILVHYEYFFIRGHYKHKYHPAYQKNFCDVLKDYNPTLLFGYFKLDRLRNVWFIFRSIQIEIFYFYFGFEIKNKYIIYINSKKLVTLSCSPQSRFWKYIQFEEFPNLIHLNFTESLLENQIKGRKIKFPRIEHLVLANNSNKHCQLLNNFNTNTLILFDLKKLKILELDHCNCLEMKNINFKNLSSLKLSNPSYFGPILSNDIFVIN